MRCQSSINTYRAGAPTYFLKDSNSSLRRQSLTATQHSPSRLAQNSVYSRYPEPPSITALISHSCNRLNNLHGGCTSTIFDVCTTTALAPIAKPGFWAFAGVSRTLNVTYLRPAPEGTKLIIESEVVHAGKRLCALKGVMKRESDGAVIAICEHGKASIDPEVSKI